MRQHFRGWPAVAESLQQRAEKAEAARLNDGQRASLREIARRIVNNGVVIADEVGMGKTRIAVEVCRCVTDCGGRVAILVPPGLGYQWQDELRQGGLQDVPPILRSLYSYISAWAAAPPQPWFEKKAVMVSHAFTNWRFGENSHAWRWAMMPELYARWRESTERRLPRGYHDNNFLADGWICGDVAQSISAAVPSANDHPVRRLLNQMLQEVQWPGPLDPDQYSKWGELRVWLERCIGFGLGLFDLVIVDEAHKSRDAESGLSRLLGNVVIKSDLVRILGLTATPVELNVSQWKETLSRVGLSEVVLDSIQETVDQYADAVGRVRLAWSSSPEARAEYKRMAGLFQASLSPYLLRRDKREDPDIQDFARHTQLPMNAYRRQTEITVDTYRLTIPWRKAICAAESLSIATRQADDSVAKRLRLTLGNGHGIAALVDQIKRSDDDRKQEQYDEAGGDDGLPEPATESAEIKRQARAEWWLRVLEPVYALGSQALFDHPAIQAAVDAIEQATRAGEKVLVFGRFTRPLRALVNLLNAREMLRRVHEDDKAWPQTKVHGDPDGRGEDNEWGAVHAAHRQLGSSVRLDTLDDELRKRYDQESHRRERFRERLIPTIEQGMAEMSSASIATKMIFEAFKRSVQGNASSEGIKHHSLVLLSRALTELLASPDDNIAPIGCATAFCQLLSAVTDRDDAEDEIEVDEDRATELWGAIEDRLAEEYPEHPKGAFARLMFGETSPASRRMIQLAFNRRNSFPHVLVAQSLVGREGLNLHKACRIVVLLHPEWNPGVVEQQIGRVDRVGSHWCNELKKAIAEGTPAPRIEVRPVIFRGTYDEHNWQVLLQRWDDLRAQLHGIVVTTSETGIDADSKALIDELCSAAPDFSPIRGEGKCEGE